MEEMAGLHLVKGNNNVSEEADMFFSERHCKTWNYACQNIQKLRSPIEFKSFMNKAVEAVIYCLTNHLSSWNQLGVKAVENILQVLSFSRLFRIKEFQKLLNKRRSNMHLKGFYVSTIIDNKLEEKLVNRLEMWPCRVRKGLFLK